MLYYNRQEERVLGKGQNETAKSVKKIKKPLDKPLQMCYNKTVNKVGNLNSRKGEKIMWINNMDLKELLDGKMDEYWKDLLRHRMEKFEAREKARQEAARREKEKLLAKVAAVLRAEPNHRYCPTDIQFILYKAEGLQLSCAKISRILLRLYWLQRGDDIGYLNPSVLMGIHMDESWHPQGKRQDDRVYYYFKPEN